MINYRVHELNFHELQVIFMSSVYTRRSRKNLSQQVFKQQLSYFEDNGHLWLALHTFIGSYHVAPLFSFST